MPCHERVSTDGFGEIAGISCALSQVRNWCCSLCFWQSPISILRCKYRHLTLFWITNASHTLELEDSVLNESIKRAIIVHFLPLDTHFPVITSLRVCMCTHTQTHIQNVYKCTAYAADLGKLFLTVKLFLVKIFLSITSSSGSHIEGW